MAKRFGQRARSDGARRGPPRADRLARVLAPGARVRVVHAKPWKRTITMSGTVVGWADGVLTLWRAFSAGGTYDSLDRPKQAGDHGTIEVVQGGWVLRRTYQRADGTPIGELYNVQTPAEIGPGGVRYVDLEVDVLRLPDGRVEVVDEADLEAAVQVGGISPAVAETARAIAHRLAEILRAGGDWREADAPFRTGCVASMGPT